MDMKLIDILEVSRNTIAQDPDTEEEFEGFTKTNLDKLPIKVLNYEVFISNRQPIMISVWDNDKMIAQLTANQLSIKKLGIKVLEILDVAVRPRYYGKAIAYNLYKSLVGMGINLASYGSHSPGAEKIWSRLGSDPNISIWGIKDQSTVLKISSKNGSLVDKQGQSVYDDSQLNLLMTKKGSDSDYKLESMQ